MVHSSLSLSCLRNKSLLFNGADSYELCSNKQHFREYSKKIYYEYNSRGFRDVDWDMDIMHESIFCVGDSFMVGIGQPFEETLPQVLKHRINTNTINISMNGASNEWMTRKVNYITENISPRVVVVQWTYNSRRECSNTELPDIKRRMHHDKKSLVEPKSNIINLINCIISVELNKSSTKILHSFIPDWHHHSITYGIFADINYWISVSKYHGIDNLKIDTDWERLDYARDYHHYDIKTCG